MSINFFNKNKIDIFVICLFLIFSPLFFYNLSGTSLVDFDEAWYAEIARNILVNRQPFLLSFNGVPYWDHPPLGFLLLTFYSALKVKNSKNWIYLVALAFSFSLLVKSMIGVTIIVPITILWLINTTMIPYRKIVQAILLFFLILSPWIIINYLNSGFSYFIHIFNVGLRSGSRMMPNVFEIGSSLTFKYLHFGIREWFYPGIIALIGSLAFLLKKPVLIVLYVWFLIPLIGFLTNSKTEIWHLIPLYPIIGLFVAFFLYQIVFYSLELVLTKKIIFPEKLVFLLRKNLTMIVSIAVFCLILVLSLKQIYEFRNEVKLFDKDTNGLAYTASAARGLSEPLYLDNQFFLPGSVFYSQKQVRNVKFEDFPNNSLKGIIAHGQKPFLLLTEQWRLDLDNIVKSKYELLAEHKGHALIRVLE